MGFGFRRNHDIWQVVQGKKYKKKIISKIKLQKTVILRMRSIAAGVHCELSQFCVIKAWTA
jgi:hypothetical protein